MSGEAHFDRKVAVSLSVGSLPTYLLCVLFLEGVQLVLNRGSIYYTSIVDWSKSTITME